MQQRSLQLPWVSLGEMEKTVMAYSRIPEYASNQITADEAGHHNKTVISKAVIFLLPMGILENPPHEKGRKRLTHLGKRLAQALNDGSDQGIRAAWQRIVLDNSEMLSLVQKISRNSPLDYSRLIELIPNILGRRQRDTDNKKGAKIIIELLTKSGLMSVDRNNRYVIDDALLGPSASSLASEGVKELTHADAGIVFVDPSRIGDLKTITATQFDVAKLVRFCQELNTCYKNECYLAVAILTRALVDHVPPIFGYATFTEVANNYGGKGDKSLKESLQLLDATSRKIADFHLHRQIRAKETLPNRTQIDFRGPLDMLLAEIVRVLA